MSPKKTIFLVASAAWLLTTVALAAPKGVQVVPDQANRRVDITIDGQPFTSYIWPTSSRSRSSIRSSMPTASPSPAAGRSIRAPASAPTIRTTTASGSTTAM